MKTKDILDILNTIAPFSIAEDWDNCGLQVGNENWNVKKMMIGLDVSMPLMNAAKNWDADLVVTHHPLIMTPEKKIDFGQMPGCAIEIAAKHQIGVVSAHTNLDKAHDGLNDYFASKIGLVKTHPFLVDDTLSLAVDTMVGIGRIGALDSQISLGQFASQIKKQLNLPHIRVTGDMEQLLKTVVVCTGSGGSLLDEFFSSKADVYVTGDMKYHDARRIEENSRGLIDVGHFGSEHLAIDLIYEKLTTAFQSGGFEIQMKKFKKEKDPFTIV